VKGILRPISLRKITALQLKRCIRKGCQLYAAHVEYTMMKNESPNISDFLVLQEFSNVFQEVSGLPLKIDIYLSIDLIPGAIPVSKTPYKMVMP